MTVPSERSQSLHNTREFLRSLIDPKQTPRIPRSIRKEAYWCLKHFPSDYDIFKASEDSPNVFGDLRTPICPKHAMDLSLKELGKLDSNNCKYCRESK